MHVIDNYCVPHNCIEFSPFTSCPLQNCKYNLYFLYKKYIQKYRKNQNVVILLTHIFIVIIIIYKCHTLNLFKTLNLTLLFKSIQRNEFSYKNIFFRVKIERCKLKLLQHYIL